MTIEITEIKAGEKSTIMFKCEFFDEYGSDVTPVTLVWTLTDTSGTPINDREQEEVVTPSQTEVIVLSGDDLQVVDETSIQEGRHLVVEATYNSTHGNGLPLREVVLFAVENPSYYLVTT